MRCESGSREVINIQLYISNICSEVRFEIGEREEIHVEDISIFCKDVRCESDSREKRCE